MKKIVLNVNLFDEILLTGTKIKQFPLNQMKMKNLNWCLKKKET